jgi:MFS family permease
VLGPVIGGFFAGASSILGITGWRWVFLVNVPIGIVALIVVFRTLHVHQVRRTAKIDWWGAVALVICLVPLLTVAEQGQAWGWGSGRSILCFVVGAIGLVAFVAAEAAMGTAALIPMQLFRIRAASVTVVASVVVGMALFGGMMMLPLYLQIVHGATPTESGLMMLPMVIGMMTASMLSGLLISKSGRPRMFPIVGSAIFTVGMFSMTQVSADSHLWLVMIYMAIIGYGVGNCMQPLILTVQSAVPPQAIGVATASATFFRQIGGTIGVAVFLSILFSTMGGHISTAFQDETPAIQHSISAGQFTPNLDDRKVLSGDPAFAQEFGKDSTVIDKLSPEVSHPFKVGFTVSVNEVFWIVGGIGVLAFVVLLAMPEVELRATSAAAAAAAARATATD